MTDVKYPAYEDLPVVWRSLWTQGVKAPYRLAYWRFMLWTLRYHPRKLPWAVAQACAGHHFITYTRETAIPRLRASRANAAPARMVA